MLHRLGLETMEFKGYLHPKLKLGINKTQHTFILIINVETFSANC